MEIETKFVGVILLTTLFMLAINEPGALLALICIGAGLVGMLFVVYTLLYMFLQPAPDTPEYPDENSDLVEIEEMIENGFV